MAARYRKTDPRFWKDERVIELGPARKLVALYLFTGQSNRCGLFPFSVGQGAEDTGLGDSFGIAMTEVCETLSWSYDERRHVLYIPTWFKYNPPENPKHMMGCLDDLHELPQTELIKAFAANDVFIPGHCREVFRRAMDSFGIAMPYQEQEQEQKQKSGANGVNAIAGSEGVEPKSTAAGSRKVSRIDARRSEASGEHAELVRHFRAGWKARYGADYPFSEGKDGAHVKWVLQKTAGDLAKAKLAVDAFLRDDDSKVLRKRHPLGWLVSGFSQYLPVPGGDNGAQLLSAPRVHDI